MILLITPYQNAPDCAAQIERATRDEVKTVNNTRLALSALRTGNFDLVVADENLIESAPGSWDTVIQRMGSASPLVIDLACLRPEKVATLVLASRKRRDFDYEMARQRARFELESELKNDVTGLLIQSELALKSEGLSFTTCERMRAVLETARRLRSRLQGEVLE